nr:hypothetical protein [Agromyces humi]
MAPATAVRLAAASVSVAYDVTPGRPSSSAARSAERFVARMPPSTSMPGCSRPDRIALAIDPAPRKAIAGSCTGASALM